MLLMTLVNLKCFETGACIVIMTIAAHIELQLTGNLVDSLLPLPNKGKQNRDHNLLFLNASLALPTYNL